MRLPSFRLCRPAAFGLPDKDDYDDEGDCDDDYDDDGDCDDDYDDNGDGDDDFLNRLHVHLLARKALRHDQFSFV